MINGLNFDFIPRAAEFNGGRPQGEGEIGKEAGFKSFLGKESTSQFSKEDKKAKDRSHLDLNAAQVSPMIQQPSEQPIGVEAQSLQEPNANKSVEFFPDSAPAAKPVSPKNVPSMIDSATEQAAPNPAEEAKQTTLHVLEMMREEQEAARRQAMREFLDSMESEFGIKPEKVLEAFAKLDGKTLIAPPEESAKEFIANLDLTPAQETRAIELYRNMLRATGEAALHEKLIGLEAGVNIDVVSPREQTLRELNRSIDELNSAFALRDRVVRAPASEIERAQRAVESMDAQIARLMHEKRAKMEVNRPAQESSNDYEGLSIAGRVGAAGAGAAAGLGAAGFGASGLNAQESFGDSMNMERWNNENEISKQIVADENYGELIAQDGEMKAPKKVGMKSASTVSRASVAEEAKALQSDLESALAPFVTESKAGTGADVAAGPSAMMMGPAAPTPEDEQANVRELIRQAQIALKNGGGEVKMELRPEGMGQVRLKVSLEDGQVNIQMMTESDAAKRLLEKGLNELRAELTAQNLKVDTMKVDVGQELQNYLDQRNDEQAREQARQSMIDLMNQFREERQAFRQSFMENPGWRQYRQGRGISMNPEPVEAAGASGVRSRPYSSGRLDLVA